MRGQTKLFKSVGVPTTCPVVTSGHSEKRGSFLNQKANWISSMKVLAMFNLESLILNIKSSK